MSKKIVFSEDDYKSGDGMMTSVWGPPMWHILHTISFNYPINPTEKQKKHYYKYYSNLKNILPCKYCRDNLANNLKTLPLTINVMKSRETLSRWVYELHELVNNMLGKKSGLCYEEVRDRYEHFRSRCIDGKEEPVNKKSYNGIEKGCTEPLYGVKSKCVLNIVPKDNRITSFKIDPICVLKKGSKKSSKKSSKKPSKKS
jgi:hypothetical protein